MMLEISQPLTNEEVFKTLKLNDPVYHCENTERE
jgi:hypothetical protein